jgi:transposase-like protein
MKRRAYTWKSKLSILEELDVDATSLNSVERKHDLSPKFLRRWRQQRSDVMTTASILCDSTSRHQFLNHRSLHPGKKTKTIDDTLGIILKMYRDLREQDRVVTLNLLAAELKRLDPGARNVIMPALRRQINRHIIKCGVVRRRVNRVAQNTRHDMTVKAGYVAFVNEGVKAGKYRACDIVKIDETNIDFDLVSGATLAGCGDRTVACTTTGSYNRCTIMLGVTMDGEKLPPFVIFKGANTPRSKIMKEFDSVESRSTFGYPEGMFYTVQAKALMDKARMHE